jgi:HK97 family phage major capsid protein
MDRLEQLREKFKEAQKRSKELRAIDPEKMKDDEANELRELITTMEALKADIDAEIRAQKLDGIGGDGSQPSGVTVEDQPVYRGSAASAFGQQAADVATVTVRNAAADQIKSAETRLHDNTKRALALIEKRQGQEPSEEFQERSFRPIFNPEARAAGTGMTQGLGSEGGFLLQSETSIDLMTNGFNNSAVLSRCQKRTLTGSESLEIIMVKETSRVAGYRGGGVRVYTDGELSQITSSKTELEKIRLAPERLTGMYYASDKIMLNTTLLGQEMRQLFMEEFAFKAQDLVVNGLGAGQALGILNAPSAISIAKETGQDATTIVTMNILNMFARFLLRGGGKPSWFGNRDIFTQLMTLVYDVGTGGELARLYIPPTMPGGTGSMLGYPVEFIEQAQTLGTAGDLWLADMNQYMTVDYGDINEASSIHFKFDYGQTAFRFIYFFDGQPRVRSAITPANGSNTVSPFVNIAVRS